MFMRVWVVFCLVGLVFVGVGFGYDVPAGYKIEQLSEPSNPTGGIAVDSDGTIIAAVGSYGSNTLVRIDGETVTSFAEGVEDTNTDDQFDTDFGAVGDIAIDYTNGYVYWTDNSTGSQATIGERVFKGEDLNDDGDVLDIVGGQPEVTSFYIPSGTGWDGAGIVVRQSDGTVYVSDSVGSASGVVYEIVSASSAITLATGFDYTAGMAFHPVTGDLYVGDVDSVYWSGRIFLIEMSKKKSGEPIKPKLIASKIGDFSALFDKDSKAPIISSLYGCYDIAFDKDGNLFVTASSEVTKISDTNADNIPDSISSFATGFGYVTGCSFANDDLTFAPGSATPSAVLYVGVYGDLIQEISTDSGSAVTDWALY